MVNECRANVGLDEYVSLIEREYHASDKRRYHVPCPACGADAGSGTFMFGRGDADAERRRPA